MSMTFVIGRITKIEDYTKEKSKPFCRFNAVERVYVNKAEQDQWWHCSASGSEAEWLLRNAKQGTVIQFSGTSYATTYQTKTGEIGVSMNMDFVGNVGFAKNYWGQGDQQAGSATPVAPVASKAAPVAVLAPAIVTEENEDVPF